ncbi:WD40 repeat domain-containing protein [Pseudomonas viridiflava]|uniref:WD40 repeat domain-containing protein n=1 Tax=Pseudomonas viridiflava TaxID=33069 RepID=UPI000F062576|nr:WD40 repeat domain-containing protein [Pseudomonas viridiflava]
MRHFGPISGITAFNDIYVATAGYDNQVILWNAKTKTPIQRVLHDHLANQCAFNADGTLLVSASSDYTARVWEVPSLRLKAVLIGHEDDIEMAAFSPDGQTIATSSRDHTIRLFDTQGHTKHILRGHGADVISVCWSADGRTLVSSSDDGSIRRWSAGTGECIDIIDLGGVETDTVALSRDGIIFAGDDEGKISVITAQGTQLYPAHAAGIKRIVWDDAQRLLVSLSYDRCVMLWHLDEQNKLTTTAQTSLPSIIWPRSCTLLGTERIAFVTFGSSYATWNFVTQEWDLNGIEPAVSLNAVAVVENDIYSIGDAGILQINGQPSTHAGSLCNFLLPFGGSVLTGGQMGTVFDARTGEALYQHRSPLNCGTTFERNGQLHAAIGTYTGEALIFCLEAGKPRFVTAVSLHENAIKGIAADEGFLFSVCATAAAAFHRISDFGLERYLDKAHARISNGCTRIEDGFASIGRDLKLRLWRNGQDEVFDTPHDHSIKCIAISQDRQHIATGSYGGTVAIFDVAKRHWVMVQKPTASGISCLSQNADGTGFLASAYDGRIYPIQVRTGTQARP